MAKITKNDLAPSDAKHFSLANTTIEVPHETDDPVVLSNAEAHPWLNVEREAVEVIEGSFRDTLDPADDVLSAQNSVANDPKAVKAHIEAQSEDESSPLAVESGLDQGVPETVGTEEHEVAITLAADDSDSTSTRKKRSSSTSTAKDND